MVEESDFGSVANRIDVKYNYLVSSVHEHMTGKIKGHLRACAIVSAEIESVYPDITVTEALKADVGVDSALGIKLTLKEAGQVFSEGAFLPIKTGKVFKRYRSRIISEELNTTVKETVFKPLSFVSDQFAVIQATEIFNENIDPSLFSALG